MNHFGFVFFVILVIVLIAYGVYMYGLPPVSKSPVQNTQNSGSQGTTYAPGGTSGGAQSYGGTAGAPSTPPPSTCGQLNVSQYQMPQGFSINDLSPCFGKITISASPGYSGSYSQITIYSYLPSSAGKINITGWLMKGNRGSQYVPQAVNVYQPSGLAPQSDIYVKNGDRVAIYSTQSAIGVNVRLNKCIGYVANANKFNPPLYLSCPYISRSDIINFSGQCQNYLMSLGNCQLPAANPPIPQNDYSCQAYINNLNYGGCFAKYSNDYDFLSNQWVAWSGSNFLDFQHDRLLLFDKQGLLVSEYAY